MTWHTQRATAARKARTVLLACLLASLAACGTTVAQIPSGTAADGLSQPTAPVGSAPAGATAAGTTGAAPGAPGTTGGAGGTSGLTPQGSTGGTATSGSTTTGGRAVASSRPVEVGFLVTKCSNCSLLGSGYVAPAHSEQDILQALVNDTNKRGGLLGRKIVPVWGEEDTASSDVGTMMAAICSSFTQDHHVVAVVGAGFTFQAQLAQCLSKAGVLAFDGIRSTGLPDEADLAAYPGYVVTGEPSYDVYALVALTSALDDGWLTTKTVLGVLDFDCPETARAWKRTVEPYLAAHHFTVRVHSTLSCPKGAGDLGSAAQGVSAAVLKMHQEGVDTVAITDIPLVVFAEDAESQQWHPKYLSTEGAAAYQAYLSTDQLQNIHSAGWEPSYDLDAQHQPAITPAQKTCLDALKRGGVSGTVASEYVLYFGLCGSLDVYLKAVAAAQDLAAAPVLRATNAIGGSLTSPLLLGGRSFLGAGRHAAAVQYRSLTYSKACSCFGYQGPVRQLPRPH